MVNDKVSFIGLSIEAAKHKENMRNIEDYPISAEITELMISLRYAVSAITNMLLALAIARSSST